MTMIINKKKYTLRNRRRFFIFVMSFVLVSVFMSMIIPVGASPTVNDDYDVIIVRQGDTLWEIAENHTIEKDIREYIYDIKKLNNLKGEYLYIGQVLMLP